MEDNNRFNLLNKRALITGGGGLLGPEHGIALAKCGASVVLVDVNKEGVELAKSKILDNIPSSHVTTAVLDITEESALIALQHQLFKEGFVIDILINNAALNPKMDKFKGDTSGRIEDYDMKLWDQEISVGITGTFLCCKVFGSKMASRGTGTIVNIASDLAIQAPDQRVYSSTGKMDDVKHFKPIGYPIVKAAMLGLNRYLATYWGHRGVRVNCLIPGAVLNTQSDDLIEKISYRVPLGRLAEKFEYQEIIAFLASDASSYMTGQEIIMDGGRSIW